MLAASAWVGRATEITMIGQHKGVADTVDTDQVAERGGWGARARSSRGHEAQAAARPVW